MFTRFAKLHSRAEPSRSEPETELVLLSSEISSMRSGPSISENRDNRKSASQQMYSDWRIPSSTSVFSTSVTKYDTDFNSVEHPHGLFRSPQWRWLWGYKRLRNSDKATPNSKPHHRGWRKMVIGAAMLTAIVFLTNLSFAIAMLTKFGAKDGVGLIFEGECRAVKRWNTIIHLFINILSTLLLSASTYTMQCLSSPTRDEVNAAHIKGISLDIGLLNVRNFFHMRPLKGLLWLCLCLSSVPLSFLWNSTVFSTGASNLSSYLIVTGSFLSGAPYELPQYQNPDQYANRTQQHTFCANHNTNLTSVAAFIYDQYHTGNYTNMTAQDCFNTYNAGDGSRYRNLILVTSPTTDMEMSKCGYGAQVWDGSSIIAIHNALEQGTNWVLESMNITDFPYLLNATEANLTVAITKELQQNHTWHFGPYLITSCFAEEYAPLCKLHFASFILYTVITCNFIKLLCMSATVFYLWDLRNPILATVGDAVSSFLENRDETTVGLCLMDHFIIDMSTPTERAWQLHDKRVTHRRGVFWTNCKRKRPIDLTYERNPSEPLYNAELRSRRSINIALSFISWILGLTAYVLAVQTNGLSKAKFGAVSKNALLNIDGDSGTGLFASIVIANACQVYFSITYVFFNSTLTARWGVFEWASYTQQNLKPLRVTWPHGQQRSTYFLQLPWKYGVPLIVLQVSMHFFISQSIFLARLILYDSFGKPTSGGFSTVGFSSSAILTAWLSWTVVSAVVLGSGWFKFDNRIPVHGNRSAVISALCHTDIGSKDGHSSFSPNNDNIDRLSTRPLMWGVVKEPWKPAYTFDYYGSSLPPVPGHCSFTDKVVELPKKGQPYV